DSEQLVFQTVAHEPRVLRTVNRANVPITQRLEQGGGCPRGARCDGDDGGHEFPHLAVVQNAVLTHRLRFQEVLLKPRKRGLRPWAEFPQTADRPISDPPIPLVQRPDQQQDQCRVIWSMAARTRRMAALQYSSGSFVNRSSSVPFSGCALGPSF